MLYWSFCLDPDIVRELQPWKELIDKDGTREVGVAKIPLQKSNCGSQECNLGSFVADAYVHAFIDLAGPDEWTYSSIALVNVGGIRTTLNAGSICL